FSYTFNNQTFKKLFGKKDNADKAADKKKEGDDGEIDTDTNLDPETKKQNSRKEKREKAEVDADGYMKFSMPWSLTVSYGITMRENTAAEINRETMRYPYKFTHSLNFSGNISISDGWNISFSSGYDFNYHKLSMTTASLSRDLHCFTMSASIVLSPYTSYNFTFQAKASALADALKWKKSDASGGNINWY
ncbi:MAG: LPS-assembly protein LptD, partial [Bacteroidaceae bacterium]|nr:LPS-assembly protein LptD [Bacteroidaceae bacterium]